MSSLNSNNITGEITVYSLLGQEVASGKFDGPQSSGISMSGAPGFYLVKVVTGNYTVTSKIFVR